MLAWAFLIRPEWATTARVIPKVSKIWLDGAFVPWDAANVHILTHTLHYGLGVFEGIRAYALDDGKAAIFRLEDHIRRLFDSATIATIPIPFSQDKLIAACVATVNENGLGECYIRPLVFLGDGAMGLGAKNETRVAIAAWKWGAYLGEEGLQKGIRAKMSSYTRPGVNSLMSKGKIVGHYVNSILAKREALSGGYEEALLLDAEGYLSEGSGENIFVIRDNVITTPSLGSSILGGLTRDTVITIARAHNYEVVERRIGRDELYIADEIFVVGTAAEVTPIREVDDRTIGGGGRGPITETIQSEYFKAVRGQAYVDQNWLTKC